MTAQSADDLRVLRLSELLEISELANRRLREEVAGLHAILEARPARALEPLSVRDEGIRTRDLEIEQLRGRLNHSGRRMTINGAS